MNDLIKPQSDSLSPCSPSTIAIDGPAASGKSTIGADLAERLGYLYFDTGVMYRAVTWAGLVQGIRLEDEAVVTDVAEVMHIDVTAPTVADGRQYTVAVDGEDVTWDIRRPEVDQNVSLVSTYPGVRAAMTNQQRRIASRGSIVMVGRDIGTVVLPNADLKIYLDASAEERAKRRWLEEQDRGTKNRPFEAVLADMKRRDRIDSSRDVAPLRPAEDAVILDSTGMTVDEVVGKVLGLVADC